MVRKQYKCSECKKFVLATEMIEHEHTLSSGKIQKLRLHEECFETWKDKKELDLILRQTFKFIKVPQEVWIGINLILNAGYTRKEIIETIKQKTDVLYSNYYEKNWPYCKRIIENNIERVRKEMKNKEQQQEEIKRQLENIVYEEVKEIKFVNKKNIDDISDFL